MIQDAAPMTKVCVLADSAGASAAAAWSLTAADTAVASSATDCPAPGRAGPALLVGVFGPRPRSSEVVTASSDDRPGSLGSSADKARLVVPRLDKLLRAPVLVNGSSSTPAPFVLCPTATVSVPGATGLAPAPTAAEVAIVCTAGPVGGETGEALVALAVGLSLVGVAIALIGCSALGGSYSPA